MAEKKPLSLNERHNRLLKDLSSQSQSGKPHSSKPGEDNPVRVKVEGRRRLCKLASRNDDGEDGVGFDEPQFSGIADFDSPPVKNVKEGSDSDVNEIRDILNDLSSRLEILSIEKRRDPKAVEPCGDSHVPCTDEAANLPGEKAEALGYTSAASSFSLSPDKSDSSSDTALQTRVSTESESEGDNFIGKDKASKGERKYDAIGVDKMPVSIGHSFVSSDDHDDDDCVVLSGNELGKEAQRRDPNFKELINVTEVDVLEEPPNDSVSEEDESIILSGTKSTYRLPGKIAKMLYPHQRDGLKWLWSIHCRQTGGILGDDMGLGKTMQICGFLAGLFHSCLIKRVLIVAPKTLLSHWIKELSVVGLAEKTREYFGSCMKTRQYELQYVLQDKGVLLTTYDIVRTSSKSLCGDYYLHDDRSEDDITWDYIILDEGHLIKNPSTQRAKSLLEIPSGHRIIISGTPIQNNLKELWALFNFCCPELLGDKKEFKERYESPILHANDKNASDREKRIGSMVAKELRKRIEPYFLRRLKSEIFNENESVKGTKLSKKNEIIVWLRLTQCQRQLYEAFLNSELVLSAFDGSPLAALTILKKICDHPYLLTKRAAEDVLEGMDSLLNQEDLGVAENLALHLSNATSSEDSQELHGNVSCKISFILSLLGNLIPEGHHVLIFSQTRKMLNLIQEAISLRGYQFLRIDGTTKASDRQIIVNDFQEGKGASIFLLTSQVGGLGLTLTRADRVIVVDPAWNPSTDNQSVDRAYRIGQEKDVIVYRLMTCGTIEEKIYKMQVFKGGLFKTATEHKEQTRYFSQRDLGELFSLPKQGFDVSLTQQQLREEHDSQHTMDETLKNHINFLESEGVAGVSHHNLLFSKTAPAPIPLEEDEILRQKGNKFVGSSSSCASREHYVDGAKYAFNPKNVKLLQRNTTTGSTAKSKELEIKEIIERLSLTLENKATISKLPDKGDRIRRQIAELNLELDKIRVAEGDEKQVIDLDDISGDLERVLIV